VSSTPRANSADQRYYGVVPAVVVDDRDPDKLGRVRVEFPWFDPDTTCDWARVATPYGGDDFGAVLTPETGSEVLVGFEFGDMHYPYILGCLYGATDKPPTSRTSSDDRKLLRTKHGHELVLDDSGSNLRIEIRTKDGHSVLLDDSNTKISITHSQGPSISISASEIEISADTIKLTASQTVKICGAQIELN
jgi:uncharacterized protein involved in type VI secretion and phage assembly